MITPRLTGAPTYGIWCLFRASRVRVAIELALEAGKAMIDARARSTHTGGMEGVSYKDRHDL